MKSRISSACYGICGLILFCFSLVTADAQNSCCNMLTNGDFELGDTGFTSDLPQDCSCTADSYCVGTNFQDKCGGWHNFNGHGGSGQFLIIDGSTGGPVDVWQNSVLISDEGEYCFSFWAASQYASAFDLGFMIDGALVGGPFTVSQSPPNWTEYSGTIFLTPGTYNIAIRQLTGGGERDFGIDDISFGASVNAGFIVDLSINCGAHLQFFNTSSGPPFLTYTWDFGDPASGSDNFSNQQHPNHLFSSCGEFEVCLIVTNGECTDIACQVVIVDEVVPPIIMCPPFIVLDCDDDLSPTTTGFATATDNCDLNPNLQYSDAPFGNIPCGGEIIRTWTATDFCGNVSTCDQNIIVFDDVPPVITCPQNVIVNALPPECKVEVNGIQWLTNTDNSGIPTVDYLITGAGAIPSFGIKDASGADFNAGISTVTYISTDQCGNKDTCMFTVTVNCIDSCICSTDEFTLDHNGVSHILSCSPGSPVPTLSCPASDVWMGGFFGCINSVSGELCDETAVNWTLIGPGNILLNSGVTTPFTQFIFPAAMIGAPGTYSLTLSSLCPGAIDTCTCTFYWIQENCSAPCPTNLVPNPDFESYSNCPTASFQLPTLSWTSPTDASPDYYNSCALVGTGVSTPINDFGNQAPRSGGGYVGLIMRPINDYREYIETPLTTPLIANHVYQVSFYVNLADNSQWAVDEIGAYLSIGSVGPVPLAPVLNFVPQIKNPTGFVITDKTNWTLISGTYTAIGGEDHIVIGNFSDNNATTTIMGLGGLFPTSYYWIEDVEVCEIYAPPCPDNIVQNPGFWLGAVPGNLNGAGQSSNWTTYGGSPQVSNSDFCADPYSIQMHDGEGICQTGFNFLQGHTYRVSFCGRFWEDPNSFATSVNFAFVAGNGCGGPNVETIGGSGSISNQSWATYTLPNWTPSQNLNTMWIRVFNVLGYTTFGRIDNICIEEVQPDTCYCGGFEDMFVRTPQGAMNMAVACGGPPLTIPCPEPGKGFYLTGVFGCEGNACPPDHQVDWSLVHQSSGTTHSGSFQDDDAFFTMYILPTYISQPGLYTLSLTGYCNGDTCMCELQFIIDCPDLCPCDNEDLISFSANVDKGFAVALANNSCKACFSPMAISDCETVEWYVNSPSGIPIGTSNGNKTFCYNFPFSGTYTIYMVVTRLKPDGTSCEIFTHSKTITLSCLKATVCAKSIWPNPGFSEGAVACMSGQDGVSEGWVGEGPSLAVLEGVEGSDDGWSVLLTGCYFSSDRLAAMKPVCTGREDKGTLVIRMRSSTPNSCCLTCRPKFSSPSGNKLTITIDDGKNVGCKGEKGCHCIAEIEDLIPIGEDDWYDVYIPYDLSEWEPTDSCGDESLGSPAILNIWMSNMLSADQGDGLVRDAIVIDQICMGGTLVSTDNPRAAEGYRLFPNPTTGAFRVTFPNPAKPNTRLRLTGLTGQVLMEQSIHEGSEDYLIDTETIAPGMYFLEVLHQGQRQAVFKVVKQTL